LEEWKRKRARKKRGTGACGPSEKLVSRVGTEEGRGRGLKFRKGKTEEIEERERILIVKRKTLCQRRRRMLTKRGGEILRRRAIRKGESKTLSIFLLLGEKGKKNSGRRVLQARKGKEGP